MGAATIVGSQINFNPATLFEDLNVGQTRTVTINYTMQDNDGAQSSANLVITNSGVNDAVVANNDSYNVNEDQTLTVPASGVLANDVDPDNTKVLIDLLARATEPSW